MAIIQTLGVASSLGGPMPYGGYAAELLRDEFARQSRAQQRVHLSWHMLYPGHQAAKEQILARLNHSIGLFTGAWAQQRKPFLVVGGDHSCAMGTWSGVLQAMPQPANFGLIWLDAHMDAHTFPTSPSGNVHGMPVAALLGEADPRLAKLYPGRVFLKAENLKLAGVRSYETAESALLAKRGVDIRFACEIDNVAAELLGLVDQLSRTCQKIGISIDLDCIDPGDAPGVATPAENGIKGGDLVAALVLLNGHPKLCALEVCEFNPENDRNNKTLHLIRAIVEAFYGDPNKPNKSLGSAISGSIAKSVPS